MKSTQKTAVTARCGTAQPTSRYALGARRSARRGRAARLCVPRGAQPLAAIVALRYALGADGVGAARLGACGSQVAASLYALGAEGMGAARPGARRRRRHGPGAEGMGAYMYMLSPPITARVASSRCSKRSVQGALRAPAEGEGGEGWSRHHHARAFGGTLVCCRSM